MTARGRSIPAPSSETALSRAPTGIEYRPDKDAGDPEGIGYRQASQQPHDEPGDCRRKDRGEDDGADPVATRDAQLQGADLTGAWLLPFIEETPERSNGAVSKFAAGRAIRSRPMSECL
jgi:hypothetical protein